VDAAVARTANGGGGAAVVAPERPLVLHIQVGAGAVCLS
jgi:hypothetical protein